MIKSGRIVILESIEIDRELPKWRPENKKTRTRLGGPGMDHEDVDIDGVDWSDIDGTTPSFGNSIGNFVESQSRDSNWEYLEYLRGVNPTGLLSIKMWIYRKLYGKYFGSRNERKVLSVEGLQDFFESAKESVKGLDKIDIESILGKYETVLKDSINNGQIALVEKIQKYSRTLQLELILSSSKFNKYLTSDQIVKFHEVASVHDKFKTGLCLTYVKNFTKVIPKPISDLKKEADKLKIFDNYLILHYDPSGKAVKATKAEKKAEADRKKDPVLFGVISGSTRLYYIGDWIDDYCDLTLDVIIKKLGVKPNLITEKSIKSNIDKI